MPSLHIRVLGDGFAPVVQQINERLLPAYCGAPTRFLTKARGVPHHDWQIDRAKEGRVPVDLDRDGDIAEDGEHFMDREMVRVASEVYRIELEYP